MYSEWIQQIKGSVVIMPFHIKSAALYHFMLDNGIDVVGFWDNSPALAGLKYDQKELSLPTDAKNLNKHVTIIIYYKKYENEIKQQLEHLGHEDFIFASELDFVKENLFFYYLSKVDYGTIFEIRPERKAKLWLDIKTCVDFPKAIGERYINRVMEEIEGNTGARKVLLISQNLGINGAPVALHNAAIALKKKGYSPVIYCHAEGNLLPSILNDGIPVLVDIALISSRFFVSFAKKFDFVIVNTFTYYSLVALNKLSGTDIQTVLWIHEAYAYYEKSIKELYVPYSSNIHIYCAGEYARKVFSKLDKTAKTKILLYGVQDMYDKNMQIELEAKAEKMPQLLRFMTVGTIEDRKGQDIFCLAIRQMASDLRSRCMFYFIGKSQENDEVGRAVFALKQDFPDNVSVIEEVSREDLKSILYQCDCMVCASRDDPMPVFMTEAMMFHKICICSENTGTSSLIEDGVNAFVYAQNSAGLLCEKMEYVVKNFQNLGDMKCLSRKIYDDNFSMDVFANNLDNIIKNCV